MSTNHLIHPLHSLLAPPSLPLSAWRVTVKASLATPHPGKTTAASNVLKQWEPKYEATVVKRLRNAGAHITGKTNMDEFGMGSFNQFSAYGACKNPHDLNRVPGGSSGGAAVAQALKECRIAIGSDTGGSVRLPASYCGVYAFKPTYESISRHGLVPYAQSLDTVGIFGDNVSDIRTVFNIIKDAPDNTNHTAKPKRSAYKIGILHELAPQDLPNRTLQTWKEALIHAAMMDCSLHSISIPLLRHAVQAYYLIACSEVASNLARFSTANLAKEACRRILIGNTILSTGGYEKADAVRRSIQSAFLQADVDFWILPVAADIAPLIKDVKHMTPIENYIGDIFTITGSLAGLPCVVVPFKRVEGMPLGIQIMAKQGQDNALLDFAEHFAEHLRNTSLDQDVTLFDEIPTKMH